MNVSNEAVTDWYHWPVTKQAAVMRWNISIHRVWVPCIAQPAGAAVMLCTRSLAARYF